MRSFQHVGEETAIPSQLALRGPFSSLWSWILRYPQLMIQAFLLYFPLFIREEKMAQERKLAWELGALRSLFHCKLLVGLQKAL